MDSVGLVASSSDTSSNTTANVEIIQNVEDDSNVTVIESINNSDNLNVEEFVSTEIAAISDPLLESDPIKAVNNEPIEIVAVESSVDNELNNTANVVSQNSDPAIESNVNNSITEMAAELYSQEQKEVNYVETCITKAIELKEQGGILFKKGVYDEAKAKYQESLGYMQCVGDAISNEFKARIFELSVACHTNVAVCSMKIKNYADGVIFARNVCVSLCFIL